LEARVLPSGEKASDQTPPACPRVGRISRPVATSQRQTRPSSSPEASVRPSREKAREAIGAPRWVWSSRTTLPVAAFHRTISPCRLPATVLPSGEKQTVEKEWKDFDDVVNRRRSMPAATSHRRTMGSLAAVAARVLPFGEKATELI